jgi:hypothetical protein
MGWFFFMKVNLELAMSFGLIEGSCKKYKWVKEITIPL